MAEHLDRTWRVIATAFCFSTFGFGGLVMRVVVHPLLTLMIWGRRRRALVARGIIHHAFRLFIGLMVSVGVISYEVRGAERLRRRGLLVLANHPSLIDVVFLIALIERADCIVKGSLARNPFTRGPIRSAGFICNDSGTDLLQECIASIRADNNLIIFPEGTRTPLSGPIRLQRGAAHVAVRGTFDITPVRIHCSPSVLTKGARWYHVPARRAHFVIEVCDDILISHHTGDLSEALAARRLTEHLTDHLFLEIPRAKS